MTNTTNITEYLSARTKIKYIFALCSIRERSYSTRSWTAREAGCWLYCCYTLDRKIRSCKTPSLARILWYKFWVDGDCCPSPPCIRTHKETTRPDSPSHTRAWVVVVGARPAVVVVAFVGILLAIVVVVAPDIVVVVVGVPAVVLVARRKCTLMCTPNIDTRRQRRWKIGRSSPEKKNIMQDLVYFKSI